MSKPARVIDLAQYVVGRASCVSSGELVEAYGYKTLRGARERGLVVEVLPRVYAAPEVVDRFATKVAAVSMWLPKSCVVSGLAALLLLGLAEQEPAILTVIAPRDLHFAAPPWMRVRRTGWVRRRELPQGVMCASRERAVIDAWADADPRQRESIVLEAMRRSNLRGSAVLRELARVPRVSARRDLMRVLDEASEGIQSYLESRAKRTVLNTPDFRGLQRQIEFAAMGKTYVVDTYDPVTRTVIEFDGAKVHGTFAAKRRDNTRDAALLTLGIATVRIGYDDVLSRPLWCREVIRRTLAARLR